MPAQQSGAVVPSDDIRNPAMEKLDLVRKWSINTYKVNILFADGFLILFEYACLIHFFLILVVI